MERPEPESEVLRSWTAGQAMTTRVYTVTPAWDLLSAIRMLRRHHISGLPVVDSRGTLVGVVSEVDIVSGLNRAAGIARPRGLLDLLLASAKLGRPELLENVIRYLRRTKVASVMIRRSVTIEPDDSLGEAARLLRQYHIKRLPVVRDGHLAGILTREDVLEAIGRVPATSPRPVRRYARRGRAA